MPSTQQVYWLNFELTGLTSTMKSYYYAGATRVAMRTGSGMVYYMLGDHPSLSLGTGLGSLAITATSTGSKYAETRYYPWWTRGITKESGKRWVSKSY